MSAKDPSEQVAEAFVSRRRENLSTRGKILDAAISVIEREGVERATVRAIAAEAGVNIAAINYHYRSKEELMNAAIESTWRQASGDLRELLTVKPDAIAEGIEALILYLLRGGRDFPNVTRAHLLGAGPSGPSPAIVEERRAFFAESARIVAAALGIPCDEALVIRTCSFFFFCFYSALVPQSLPPEISSGDFSLCAKILAKDYLEGIAR